MSFDLPAQTERDLELYAMATHTSPADAAVKLLQDALRSKKRKVAHTPLSDAELDQLRTMVPTFAFFEKLPDSLIETMEATSKGLRAFELKNWRDL